MGQSAGKPFKVDEYFSAIPMLRSATKVQTLYDALFRGLYTRSADIYSIYENIKARIYFLNTEIIHGDLNPRNILVDMDGSIYFNNFQRSTRRFKVKRRVKGDHKSRFSPFYETHLEKNFWTWFTPLQGTIRG